MIFILEIGQYFGISQNRIEDKKSGMEGVLFISLTALFDTIHEFHYTISANFYFYLQYFQ